MNEHRHTDECLAYAAKTGKAYCIASCADTYRAERDEVRAAVRTLLDGGWLVRPKCEHDILDAPCQCATEQAAFDTAVKVIKALAGEAAA